VHGLLLAAIGLWCFLVALAGGLAGLVLGNIRLPVLLFASSSPAAAGGANIAISGLAAAAASLTHVRRRRVEWRLVAWMLPPSVAGALLGGFAAGHVPADALRIVIGTALLAFGVDLLRPRRGGAPVPRETRDLRAAVVAGTRLPVRAVALDWRKTHDRKRILRNYPQLTPELLAEVIHYYEAHQAEIDTELRAEEEAEAGNDGVA